MDIVRTVVDSSRKLTTSAPRPRRVIEAAHRGRQRVARLRAGLGPAREAVADIASRTTVGRRAGRMITPIHAPHPALATLDALSRRCPDELLAQATAGLRHRLARDRPAAGAARRDGDGDPTIAAPHTAIARTPTGELDRAGLDAFARDLRRIYRHGRKAMRVARESPTAANLDDWRTRTQDLRRVAELGGSARPKELVRVARRAGKLASLLGEHHDLRMLRAYAESHPRCFDDRDSQQTLLAVIDRRARRLRKKSLTRGDKLYSRKPKRFVRDVARAWRKRAAGTTPHRRLANSAASALRTSTPSTARS